MMETREKHEGIPRETRGKTRMEKLRENTALPPPQAFLIFS